MHFTVTYRPKLQKSSLWCPPWGYPVKPLNKVDSKETKSLGENSFRQKGIGQKPGSVVFIGCYSVSGDFSHFYSIKN